MRWYRGFGSAQWRPRWKIVRWSTSGAIAGTICIELAPVPTTPTRFPWRSRPWSQYGRVEPPAAEPVEPLEVGDRGPVEHPDRADERPHLGLLDRLFSWDRTVGRGRPEPEPPHSARLVVDGADQLGPEAKVRGEPVLLDDRVEVAAQLVALGEERGPVGVGNERVRVEVVGHVDPEVGEAVLVPGAPDRVVLLVDREGDAELLQPDRRAESAEAGADDADMEPFQRFGVGRDVPRRAPGVTAVEVALLARAGRRRAARPRRRRTS